MTRDDAILLDIVNAARRIQSFVQDMAKEAFLADLKTQSAVLHQITVMGEAAKRLSMDFRDLQPVLPRALMSGMRDHLIHGYEVIDLDEVWNTLTHDVPEVLVRLEPLVPRPPAERTYHGKLGSALVPDPRPGRQRLHILGRRRGGEAVKLTRLSRYLPKKMAE